MAYGDYSGPKKADKGKKGGSCNVTSCQKPGANYLHQNGNYYCIECRDWVNSANTPSVCAAVGLPYPLVAMEVSK